MLAQEPENPLFSEHSRALCAVVVQLLQLHDLLHCRASMQAVLVVIVACLDSTLWLDCLVSNAAALEAVFQVLVNESGFEEEAGEEEALQGQEAAGAVLAVVARQVHTAPTAMKVTTYTPFLTYKLHRVMSLNECGVMCRGGGRDVMFGSGDMDTADTAMHVS